MRSLLVCLAMLGISLSFAMAAEYTLIVELPADIKPKVATAAAPLLKLETKGELDGQTVTFRKVLPDTAYDVRIELADGKVLQGANMDWYMPEPAGTKHEAIEEEDRKQIDDLFAGIKAFENKRSILLFRGNHDHATVLAELIRDTPFHSAKEGEVIWRVELWYFKNQHGGWEKISQQSKVLRRERFTSPGAFEKEARRIQWRAELGGITLAKGELVRRVRLEEKK